MSKCGISTNGGSQMSAGKEKLMYWDPEPCCECRAGVVMEGNSISGSYVAFMDYRRDIMDCNERIATLEAELHIEKQRAADAGRLFERCRLEAISWRQEARTQQSIVLDCYKAARVTGKGDWNGAQPVTINIAKLEAQRDELLEALKACHEIIFKNSISDAETARVYNATTVVIEKIEAAQ